MKSVSLLAILGTGAATQIIDLSASARVETKIPNAVPCDSVCSATPEELCNPFRNVREFFENDLCAPCLSCQEKACEDHKIGDDCTAPDGNTGICNTYTSRFKGAADFMDYDVKLKCLVGDIAADVTHHEAAGTEVHDSLISASARDEHKSEVDDFLIDHEDDLSAHLEAAFTEVHAFLIDHPLDDAAVQAHLEAAETEVHDFLIEHGHDLSAHLEAAGEEVHDFLIAHPLDDAAVQAHLEAVNTEVHDFLIEHEHDISEHLEAAGTEIHDFLIDHPIHAAAVQTLLEAAGTEVHNFLIAHGHDISTHLEAAGTEVLDFLIDQEHDDEQDDTDLDTRPRF